MQLSPTERICYERNLKDMRKTVEALQTVNGPMKSSPLLSRHFTQLRQVWLPVLPSCQHEAACVAYHGQAVMVRLLIGVHTQISGKLSPNLQGRTVRTRMW